MYNRAVHVLPKKAFIVHDNLGRAFFMTKLPNLRFGLKGENYAYNQSTCKKRS